VEVWEPLANVQKCASLTNSLDERAYFLSWRTFWNVDARYFKNFIRISESFEKWYRLKSDIIQVLAIFSF
jgi:hypothetical protein